MYSLDDALLEQQRQAWMAAAAEEEEGRRGGERTSIEHRYSTTKTICGELVVEQ